MDCTRTTDSVARWGGEEFLILLTDTELNGAQVIAERIRRSIAAEPMRSEQTDIKIAMTLGVAQFTEGESFSNVVARADAASARRVSRGLRIWPDPFGTNSSVVSLIDPSGLSPTR